MFYMYRNDISQQKLTIIVFGWTIITNSLSSLDCFFILWVKWNKLSANSWWFKLDYTKESAVTHFVVCECIDNNLMFYKILTKLFEPVKENDWVVENENKTDCTRHPWKANCL